MQRHSSNLFEGYKSLGFITGPKPFLIRHAKNPQDSRIITIVGRTFHTYTSNLILIEASLPHEYDISCLIADKDYIYSASGYSIIVWGRGSKTLVKRLDRGHQANIKLMSKFGVNKILSIDEDNVLFNWGISDQEILNIISFDEGTFAITTICHPYNYADKALIGSKQGHLQLWNISNEQCLYKFEGWDSEVTCLVQSPTQDVVGIGLADGHVYIHNIKYDEVIMKIYQEYGPVTSMTFRLDGQPYLVTASEIGHLMIWNLEKKKLSTQIRHAHKGSISRCQFFLNESLLVTSSSDNSLKVWSLDSSIGGGSLLYQRAGHSEPPSQIRFYGPKGFNLLSAGNDSSLKMFHVFSERLSRNLGTARSNPKSQDKSSTNILPPITCFAAEPAREKSWDNIAACHRGTSLVTTWNYDKCKMGDHYIHQSSFAKHGVYASSICITGCGNFVIIGFSNGLIFKYNLQSGIFRGAFESPKVSENRAHDGEVTGLTVDGIDFILISGGKDSILRMWNFKTGLLLSEDDCQSKIVGLNLHRENNLLAIALENFAIEIRDIETRTLVRKFEGKSKIFDFTFTPDSMWLIVSYDDASIRTWDLQLGKLIDSFRLSTPAISISMSSTGEFLATAHKDSLGISIWSNYSIYYPKAIRAINQEDVPTLLDVPFVRCDERVEDEEEGEDLTLPMEGNIADNTTYISPDQLNENLITLSGLPTSRWKNLLNIDDIREKQRIRQEEKREKQVKIPFFIPVKEGLKPRLDEDAVKELNKQKKPDQVLELSSRISDLRLLSPLAKSLIDCGTVNSYKPFLLQLKELGPSATDAEIRSMGSDSCGDNQVMLCFLDAMRECLKSHIDYELVCSWLALFLKAHSDIIKADAEVQKKCSEILKSCNWDNLNEKFNQIFCVLNFIRSSIL